MRALSSRPGSFSRTRLASPLRRLEKRRAGQLFSAVQPPVVDALGGDGERALERDRERLPAIGRARSRLRRAAERARDYRRVARVLQFTLRGLPDIVAINLERSAFPRSLQFALDKRQAAVLFLRFQ